MARPGAGRGGKQVRVAWAVFWAFAFVFFIAFAGALWLYAPMERPQDAADTIMITLVGIGCLWNVRESLKKEKKGNE